MTEVTPEFVRRLAEQADQLAEDRVERNARIRDLEEALEEARYALMDVARTRRSDAWGTAVARANEALATIEAALPRT